MRLSREGLGLLILFLLVLLPACLGRPSTVELETITCREWVEDLSEDEKRTFGREMLIEFREEDLPPGKTDTPTDASVGFFIERVNQSCTSNLESDRKGAAKAKDVAESNYESASNTFGPGTD